jgi:hypothetical protein
MWVKNTANRCSSLLRLRVDGLCYLLRAAVAQRRQYPYPAAGDSGLVAGPTEPRALYGGSGSFLFPEQFVQFAAPPHLVRVRGLIEGSASSPLLALSLCDSLGGPVAVGADSLCRGVWRVQQYN